MARGKRKQQLKGIGGGLAGDGALVDLGENKGAKKSSKLKEETTATSGDDGALVAVGEKKGPKKSNKLKLPTTASSGNIPPTKNKDDDTIRSPSNTAQKPAAVPEEKVLGEGIADVVSPVLVGKKKGIKPSSKRQKTTASSGIIAPSKKRDDNTIHSPNTLAEPAAVPNEKETGDVSAGEGVLDDTSQRAVTNTLTSSDPMFVDKFSYDPPFTIFERFIPLNGWNEDPKFVKPFTVFSVTGERRKKQVRDNFDWLLPSTRHANMDATMQAYSSNYLFTEGFQSSNKMFSTSSYVVPQSVDDRLGGCFCTHTVAMSHPLCNIEQGVNWLAPSVGNLINRIHSVSKRPVTRSSLQDARMGQDIFMYSTYVHAKEFLCHTDDVTLIDFFENDSSKKIWHCSNVCQSNMLAKAIVTTYYVSTADDARYALEPEWLAYLKSASLSTKKDGSASLQFLGFVSLYHQSKSEEKVCAFHLHSFVLYRFDNTTKMTRVHLLLTQTELSCSSIQERLLQILQMIQSDLVLSSVLVISPEFVVSPDLVQAYSYLGFTPQVTIDSTSNHNHTTLVRKSVIKLTKCTNRTLWARYGQYLSLPGEPEEGTDALLNMMCRMVGEILLRPIDSKKTIGTRFPPNLLDTTLLDMSRLLVGKNVDQTFKDIIKVAAAGLTRIPLSIFSHVVLSRLNRKKGESKRIHETTLELIQHIHVAMVSAVPHHKAYIGDRHNCSLFCDKCKLRFGVTGNICVVLAQASNAILYHHGLELRRSDTSSDINEPIDESRFKVSLPMHTMPMLMDTFSLSIIEQMDKLKSQRCRFGTGERCASTINVKHLHSLCEAMMIDTYFSGNESILKKRANLTSAFLLSLFDVAYHRHGEIEEPSQDEEDTYSFDDYAVQLPTAIEQGEKWIQDNVDKDIINQHRVLQGWGISMSQLIVLNYCYVCKRIYVLLEEKSAPPFTLNELLAKIGVTNQSPHLMEMCLNYDLSSNAQHDFACNIVQVSTDICLTKAVIDRPIQEDVIEESFEEKGTMSRLGNGWNKKICMTWFTNTNASDDDEIDVKTIKNNYYGRNISSMLEAEETLIILKTLSSIVLEYENDSGRGYSMRCKVDDIIKKNPSVLKGPHKSFYENPNFECSNAMITSLPFEFVKKLRVGTPHSLPPDWLRALRNDAKSAESSNIKSIQLWCHRRIMVNDNETKIDRIYLIEKEEYDRGKLSIKQSVVKEKIATFYLKKEPWILNNAQSLCSVRNYKKIVFGEGAKTSRVETVDIESNGVMKNVWSSDTNHSKLCTEGCVFNMLCHMNLRDDAEVFRRISTIQSIEGLKVEMGVNAIPKRVIDIRHSMDPIEKCIWILEKCFNCRRFGNLNVTQFPTSERVVQGLLPVRLPVILSVVGKQSYFNHVVVVWRSHIIDFESEETYHLTVNNVENICGPKNCFLRISRGYVILPSRKMKAAIGDISDWGEKDLLDNFSHLFTR